MQRRYAWVLAAGVGLLAGVASCSSDGNGGGAMEPETGTISGTVAAAGTGVGGASLTLARGQTTRSATSSNAGAFSFTGVETGSWTLTVDPPDGFVLAAGQNASVPVTVNANQTTTVNIALEEEEDPGSGAVLITLSGTSFSDDDVTISVGQTVRWENRDGTLHTVTPDGHSQWTEVVLDSNGESFEHTFNTAGTYAYYCNPHRSVGMTGVIRVQ